MVAVWADGIEWESEVPNLQLHYFTDPTIKNKPARRKKTDTGAGTDTTIKKTPAARKKKDSDTDTDTPMEKDSGCDTDPNTKKQEYSRVYHRAVKVARVCGCSADEAKQKGRSAAQLHCENMFG